LSYGDKELPGHGREYHREGFGSPIGEWKSLSKAPDSITEEELHDLGLASGKQVTLEFASGVTVTGKLEKILRRDHKLILLSFSDCTVKFQDRVLFEPSWGIYDMAVGAQISSVFNGAADKDAYNQVALVPKERTIKVPSDAKRRRLENLYAQVRQIRESKAGYERLGEIWETQQAEHGEDWLLSMEIFEILDQIEEQKDLKDRIDKFLNQKRLADKEKAVVIEWGFRLVKYHRQGIYVAPAAR
jgi:phenylalanine-4-hydroxylase